MFLDELEVRGFDYKDKDVIINNSGQIEPFKNTMSILAWRWYYAQDPKRVILTLRKWFLSYTITVESIYPLFVWLFGNQRIEAL